MALKSIKVWVAFIGLTIGIFTTVAASAGTLSSGYYGTCMLADGGAVRCWGDGYEGISNVPSSLSFGAKQVEAATGYACALNKDSVVECWGWDTKFPQPEGSIVPSGLKNVREISLGTFHSCAVIDAGIRCWGLAGVDSSKPIPANGLSALVSGYEYSCGLFDGSVRCWGKNGYLPKLPSFPEKTVARLVAWENGLCAIKKDGSTSCAATDGEVTSDPEIVRSDATAIRTGSHKVSCALAQGKLKCKLPSWEVVEDTEKYILDVPKDVLISDQISEFTSGRDFACVLIGKRPRCWGMNYGGQAAVPFDLLPAKSVSDFGINTRCAIGEFGNLSCMRINKENRNLDWSSFPKTIASLSGIESMIGSPVQHVCAVAPGEGIYCWGYTSRLFTPIPYPRKLVAFDTGSGSPGTTCALDQTTVKCWGDINDTVENVIDLRSNDDAYCALTQESRLQCNGFWGAATFAETSSFLIEPATICAVSKIGGVKCYGDRYFGAINPPANLPPTSKLTFQAIENPKEGYSAGAEVCANYVDRDPICWRSRNLSE
jgi:hypothetical protein